jgi:DNA-binding transcriptional MerR regulator
MSQASDTMFSIGEFSRITGLTVKTLRFYHEQNLLIPSYIQSSSGYRFYDAADIERARLILRLRELEFPLEQIRQIVEECNEDSDALRWLEQQRRKLAERQALDRARIASLNTIIACEKKGLAMQEQTTFEIEEKELPTLLMAGIRVKGRYEESGKAFATLGKNLGRYASGKAFCLYYDEDYKEEDADFECCLPISQTKTFPGIACRELGGGPCISLMHQGPYEEMGRTYEKLFIYLKQKGYRALTPSRSIFHKGPGMLFRGNPQHYLTELQIPIEK